jgi:hypothetical protein
MYRISGGRDQPRIARISQIKSEEDGTGRERAALLFFPAVLSFFVFIRVIRVIRG